MQKVVVGAVGYDAEDINITQAVPKIYEDELKDFETVGVQEREGDGVPKFTEEEIDKAVEQLQDLPTFSKTF